MALTETEELELLELEAAASKKKPTKRRGSGRKKTAARRAEAGLRGVTSGLLGVGDVAAAAGDVIGSQAIRPLIGKERLPLTAEPTIEDLIGLESGIPIPRERLGSFGRVRAERKALEQDFPVTSGAGNITGALLPISRVGQVLDKLGLGLKAGKTASNTAKVAAGGAAAGGLTEANLGGDVEDIKKGAVVSGVAAPVVGAAVRGAGQATQAVRSILDQNPEAGFRALSKALKREGRRVSPEQLAKRASEFKEATGRNPTVIELVGERGGQDVAEVVQSGSRAQERILNAAEERARELQQNLAGEIQGGRVSTAAPRLLERRGASMDAFMNKKDRFGAAGRNLGEKEITLDEDAVNILLDPDNIRALPPQAKQALFDIQEGEAGAISLRQLDNIRQAFRKAGKAGGEAARFTELADIVRDIGIEDVPEYGAALGEFARRSELAAGVNLGERIRSIPTTEFRQALTPATPVAPGRASPSLRAGARVGARQELAESARGSPSNAAETARSLAEDVGLQERLRTLDPREAARLQGVGEAETEALRSVSGSIRGLNISSAAQEEADNIKAVLEAGILSTGRASGGFQANFATRLINRFKVPPTAANRLAEAVTDPARTEEAIEILIRTGVPPKEITALAQAASRATSRTAGPAATEEN